MGLVGDIFGDARVIASLPGTNAVGHNRYATTGATILRNVQPLYADFEFGGFAVAHNGNLTNAHLLRRALVRRGCLFQSTTDSEVFVHLIAISLYSTVVDRLIDALKQVVGAYSLVALSNEALMGVRDPLGVRPLILGRIMTSGGGAARASGGWVLASETCALDIVGAEFVRDIEPGEIVVINDQGVHSIKPFGATRGRFCVFEHIYFARPDSVMEGTAVYDARKRIGAELARESHVAADVIVPVPDSGVPAAMGYAGESGVPFDLGIIRNHYVGRTFIEPTDSIRNLGVRLKHSANRAVLAGRRVVLVDDSIVRGTTSRKIVEMVRAAGAAEVHMRISSPPTTHSCFYGIDTPERGKLLAARHSVEEMAELIGADSLAFVSLDGLYRALGRAGREAGKPYYCDACFTGEYPIALPDMQDTADRQLSLLTESR
jgi:amidophosphoribosyltransferase